MKRIRPAAILFLLLGACTGQQSSEPLPAEESSTQVETASDIPQELVYDLRGIRQFRQLVDLSGRVIGQVYELGDGTEVKVDYDWTGGTSYCTGAKAQAKGKLIAEGKLQRLDGNQSEGWRLVVDEVQYRDDGTVAYRGTSTFSFGIRAQKMSEWPQEGRKLYEVFVDWGTLMPGGPF